MIFRIQSFKQAAFWSTAIGAFSQGLALLFGMLMAALFGAALRGRNCAAPAAIPDFHE